MLPIIIFIGLLIGRWWFVPAAGFIWLFMLASDGSFGLTSEETVVAFLLGAANALVGVSIRRGFDRLATAISAVIDRRVGHE